MNEKVKITLVKSLIGSLPKQKTVASSLGLKRIGDSIIQNNDQVLAGKIKLISHLVKIDAANE